MGRRTDIWTYLIITAITLLIWLWANGETRIDQNIDLTVVLSVADPENWQIDRPTLPVKISVEGSQRAIRDAEQRLRRLSITLAAEAGPQPVDLLARIRKHPDVRATGISVIATVPLTVEPVLDALVRLSARVRPVLPGVQIVDDIDVQPPQVELTMPEGLRQYFSGDLFVEAVVERQDLDRLTPGARHTLDAVKIRLPERLPPDSRVTVSPRTVRMQFTIRSRIRTLRIEAPVRIKLVGDPDDLERVEVDPKQLRNVTITAPIELIEKIEANEAVLVALLYLKSSERESRITSKPVTCFMAMPKEPGERGHQVDAVVGDTGEWPVVALTITGADDG